MAAAQRAQAAVAAALQVSRWAPAMHWGLQAQTGPQGQTLAQLHGAAPRQLTWKCLTEVQQRVEEAAKSRQALAHVSRQERLATAAGAQGR